MLTTNRLRPRTAPWFLFDQLQKDLHREFSDWLTSGPASDRSLVNVWSKEGAAILTLEAPGRSHEDFDVSIQRDVISIEAKESTFDLPEGATSIRSERTNAGFQRQIQLPFEIDQEQIEASYERGLLIVRLQAVKSEQPAKVAVTAG